MNPIIEVHGLSKKYKVTKNKIRRYTTLGEGISVLVAHLLAKIGLRDNSKRELMVLDGIDFKINPGDVIGLTGRNGAGKSTLLKLLSRITPPTSGSILLRGSVASLLEVGTGFHPELSGRENVYLNGSILGMKVSQIRERFEAIVEFSGVQDFIDEPVKHYSSGMKVRLAFSIAAHLDADILIIDEVLSVGDQDFKVKSFAKMQEIIKDKDRTIILVSHDEKIISGLATRIFEIENGKLTEKPKE